MKQFVLVLFLMFNFLNVILAQTETGMAFLKLPVDARSAAMGETGAAYANDAAAVHWNVALLAKNQNKSLVFMHNAYLANIAQEFGAFQFTHGKHSFAVALNLMSIPGIEIRGQQPTEKPVGTTEAINLAAGLSYARMVKKDWSIGLSVKYLYEKYYLEDASGWALDIGFFKTHFLLNSLDFGLSLQNLGKMKPLNVKATKLPFILRSGLLYHSPVLIGHSEIRLTFDATYLISEKESNLAGGIEVPILTVLNLRSGINYYDDRLRYSIGFGLNYQNYQFNYAFSPYPYNLGNSHRFSLHLLF